MSVEVMAEFPWLVVRVAVVQRKPGYLRYVEQGTSPQETLDEMDSWPPAIVAQWIEHPLSKREVPGSIPGRGVGELAQWYERSLCMRQVRGSTSLFSILHLWLDWSNGTSQGCPGGPPALRHKAQPILQHAS